MNTELIEIRKQVLAELLSGNYDAALSQAKSAIQDYPDDSKLNLIYGTALEQTGSLDEAFPFIKKAAELDPHDTEALHNLAVALYNRGDYTEAAQYCNEVLNVEPSHEGASELLGRCEALSDKNSFRLLNTDVKPSAATKKEGPDDSPRHVLNLGAPWTRIGYGILFYCIFSLGFMIFHPVVSSQNSWSKDPMAIVAFFLYVTAGIGSLIWMLIDIIDRREKFIWLLPVSICGLFALPMLPLALYMAFRKNMMQLKS